MPEPGPARAHPDVAGWVLGALSSEDMAEFEAHLPSCAACQAELRQLESLPALLDLAAPAVDVPEDLTARTLDVVRRAATAERHRRRVVRLVTAAAVVAIAAVGTSATVALLHRRTPAPGATFALSSPYGTGATGRAADFETANGWRISLSVRGLPALGEKAFYECWYIHPGDRPGHPNRVSAGTFEVPANGRGDVRMWGWADPHEFRTMEITREPADGNPAPSGDVVLRGTART